MTVESVSVVMLGVTGAFRGEVAKTLLNMPELGHLTLLGRRPLSDISSDADNVAEKLFSTKSTYSNLIYTCHSSRNTMSLSVLSVLGSPQK